MQSFGYILNHRPFRDTSLLVDIFTEDYGRICCVARPAKKRGKILKGSLEPFRYLSLQWIGKGDVQTLTEADERGRHTIPPSEMMMGLYLNELLLLLTQKYVALPELFSAYKYTLHKLNDPEVNKQIMMQFELYLLASLGLPLIMPTTPQTDEAISAKMRYRFSLDDGLILSGELHNPQSRSINIEGDLLIALQGMKSLNDEHWKQLRQFLDAVFLLLSPRTINSRKLLHL
ncbi:MAG: DNA repair protein RecO [Cocleimonas sp.]|nr:DNA repair protein RecO [Cocleimonas sp.]